MPMFDDLFRDPPRRIDGYSEPDALSERYVCCVNPHNHARAVD